MLPIRSGLACLPLDRRGGRRGGPDPKPDPKPKPKPKPNPKPKPKPKPKPNPNPNPDQTRPARARAQMTCVIRWRHAAMAVTHVTVVAM